MINFEGTKNWSIDGVFDTHKDRHLPANGTIMDLTVIREGVKLSCGDGDEPLEFDFIPELLFVRGDMEEAFKELLREQQAFPSVIFSGSAGIGKSVLVFLVVLYRAVSYTHLTLPTIYSV